MLIVTISAAGLLVIAWYVLIIRASAEADVGATTEIAAIATVLLGALAWTQPTWAVPIAVAVVALLAAKRPLHRFATRLVTDDDISHPQRLGLHRPGHGRSRRGPAPGRTRREHEPARHRRRGQPDQRNVHPASPPCPHSHPHRPRHPPQPVSPSPCCVPLTALTVLLACAGLLVGQSPPAGANWRRCTHVQAAWSSGSSPRAHYRADHDRLWRSQTSESLVWFGRSGRVS
ncbi:hypothetical protein [Saccharopolyspora shandongensis]|uniref:hypothetical protein n=1 Tax=Saccharopolyspora shandongensis TaxID=418495 RepID=UPI001FE57452|nr:hypothetical protein [Saccharopolyspora shandongensis]